MNNDMIPLPKKISGLPIVITGTWEGAQKSWAGARLCEELKTYFQMMTGLELLALQSLHSDAGKRRDLTSSHDGKRLFGDLIEDHLPFSKSTAYRLMEIATAAVPRLRNNPELKDFDPIKTPMSELTEAKREALSETVKKLTDGKTQLELGLEWGLHKNGGRSPGRQPGCDNARKASTVADQVALLRHQAAQDWQAIEKMLRAYGAKFLNRSSDAHVQAEMAVLERALRARQAWLRQPVNNRNPRLIQEMFD